MGCAVHVQDTVDPYIVPNVLGICPRSATSQPLWTHSMCLLWQNWQYPEQTPKLFSLAVTLQLEEGAECRP